MYFTKCVPLCLLYYVCVLSSSVAQSHLIPCNPVDCSPPGSSVHGILQGRILEWVSISFSQGIFLTQGLNLCLLHWQADSLPLNHLESPFYIVKVNVLVAQSCLTLCNPLVCTPPGSSVYGIFKARILECVSIHFSRGSSNSGTGLASPTLQADLLPSEPQINIT